MDRRLARLLDQINALADSNAQRRQRQLEAEGKALASLLHKLRANYEQSSSSQQHQQTQYLLSRTLPLDLQEHDHDLREHDHQTHDQDLDLPFPVWALLHVRRGPLKTACQSIHGQAVQRFQARSSEKRLGKSSLDNFCKQVSLTGPVLCFLWHPDVVGSQVALRAVRSLQRQRAQKAQQQEQLPPGNTPSSGESLAVEISRRFHAQVRSNSSGPKRKRLKPLANFQRALVDLAGDPDIWPITVGTTRSKMKTRAVGQLQQEEEDDMLSGDDMDIGHVEDEGTPRSAKGDDGKEHAGQLQLQQHSDASRLRSVPPDQEQPQSIATPEQGRKHAVQSEFRLQSLSPLPSPFLSPTQSRMVSPSFISDSLEDLRESNSQHGEAGSEDEDNHDGMYFQDDPRADYLHVRTVSKPPPLALPQPPFSSSGRDMLKQTSSKAHSGGDANIRPGQEEGNSHNQSQDQCRDPRQGRGMAGVRMQTALSLARLKQGDHDHDPNTSFKHNNIHSNHSSLPSQQQQQQQHYLTPIEEIDQESSTTIDAAASAAHKRERTPGLTPTLLPGVRAQAEAQVSISSGHRRRPLACFPSLPLSTSPRQVADALGRNQRLTSDEIALCLHFYFRQARNAFPDDVTIFDPGFPFSDTEASTPSPLIQHPERLTRRLIFIFNYQEHWTVGHLDRDRGILLYFDSASRSSRKALDWAKKYLPLWLATNNLSDTPIQVRESEPSPPQQQDDYNCGMFAMSFAISLATDGVVDRVMDPSRLRGTMAAMLRGEETDLETETKAGPSYQPPEERHLDGDGCGNGDGDGEADLSGERNRKRPRRDTSLPSELAEHIRRYQQQPQRKKQRRGQTKLIMPPTPNISTHAYSDTANSSSGSSVGNSGNSSSTDTVLPPSRVVAAQTSTSTPTSVSASIEGYSLDSAVTDTADKCKELKEAGTNEGNTVHLVKNTAPVLRRRETSLPVTAAQSLNLRDLVGQLDPHLPPTLSSSAILDLVGSYFPVAQAEANKHVAAAKALQVRLQYELGQIIQVVVSTVEPPASKPVAGRNELSSASSSDTHQGGEEKTEEDEAEAIAQAQLLISQARCRQLLATITEHKVKADELRRRISSLQVPATATPSRTTERTFTTTVFSALSLVGQDHTEVPGMASSSNEKEDDNEDDNAALLAWAHDAEVLTAQIHQCVARRGEAQRLYAEAQSEAGVWTRRIDALGVKRAEIAAAEREMERLSLLLGWVDRLGDLCQPDQPIVLPGSNFRTGRSA